MNRENAIHISQLFRLMVLFELGTALVFPLNAGAKEAAWVATLLGMAVGLIVYVVQWYTAKEDPHVPFTVVFEGIIGKVPGKILAFMYTLFFMYQASLQFADFSLLMKITIFDQTPLIIVHLMLIIAIGYVLSLGVMALARTGEIFYLIMLFMIVLASILLLFSSVVEINRLMPVLGDGMSGILKTFPRSANFPFTQVIALMMLTPFLKENGSLLRMGLISIIISGVILAWITALNISVLGVDIINQTFFPLLMSIGEIDISHFIQRLDAIAVIMLITGVIFRASVYYLASVVAVTRLFHISSYRLGVLMAGTVIFVSAIVISPNSAHQIREGLVTNTWLIYVPFEVVIPVLIALCIWTRKRLHNRQKE